MQFYAFKRGHRTPFLPPKLLVVMKITTILLLAFNLTVSAATFAQQITLSEKNAKLTDVLKTIRTQSGYELVYRNDLVDGKTITLDLKGANLEEALKKALEGQHLTYTIQDGAIIIKAEETTSFIDKIKAVIAQVTITGKVNDETGQPLSGVTVKIKNTNQATATDKNGAYTITAPDDKTIISFSFIGYETQEFAAKDIPNGSTITLKASTTNLNEVVVNKGYYSVKKIENTGNVSTVTAAEIDRQPVTDPIQALIGRVPGLNIQQASGVPGTNNSVRIRGVNSIANGNDPLYIVDGVQFNGTTMSTFNTTQGPFASKTLGNQFIPGGVSPFNVLAPGDIESIEVLKDADATAIYGSRGANGVILITTKKGQIGAVKVNANVSQGIGQVSHFVKLLNLAQYQEIIAEASNNYGSTAVSDGSTSLFQWDQHRDVNWQKILIGNNAHYTNAQLNLSGGNTNTQFLIAGNYSRNTTVFPGNSADQKGGGHFSITHTSQNQRFKTNFTTSYNIEKNSVPGTDFTRSYYLAPNAPELLDASGNINWGIINGAVTFADNPLAQLQRPNESNVNSLVSGLNVSYRLFDKLTFHTNLSYNRQEAAQTSYSYGKALPPPLNTIPGNRTASFGNNIRYAWVAEPQLDYSKILGQHAFQFLLGATFQSSGQNDMWETASGFANDAVVPNLLAATSFQLNSFNQSQYRYNAIYARFSYKYADKYFFNFTGRRDGSSRFGPGRQWGNFGAIGAAWIFSKEKWLKNLSWLDLGKFRVSYGITGNDQTGDYKYLSTYSALTSNTYGNAYQGLTGLAPTLLANPNFGWEQVAKLEFGLELSFLNNRLNLETSYYRNRTSNQLVGYPLPFITGFNIIPAYNLPAVIQNKGLEISVNAVLVKTLKFKWGIDANFTLPDNKLISFPGLASSTYAQTYTVGTSLFAPRGLEYTGINTITGIYTFKDQNGDGRLSSLTDYLPLKPITQIYYGGLATNLTYGPWRIDILAQLVKQNGLDYRKVFGAPGFNNVPVQYLDRWTQPGDLTQNQVVSFGQPYNSLFFGGVNSGTITDASFIRLKNVAISYSLPKKIQDKLGLSNTRISLQGQNLWTFTKYIGFDPETQSISLPPLRVIALNLQTSF